MGRHYLHRVFAPNSIAVVGASSRKDSVGYWVFRNLVAAEYRGELHAVNPNHGEVQGKKCVATLADIEKPVDIVVVATPASTVPDLVRQCGEQGAQGIVIISAGFRETGAPGKRLEQLALDRARQYGVRIVGPNCLGIMRPSIGMNATFSHNAATQGDLALVSQSGALCTSILDWALANHVGFSSMISLGAASDIGFGEVLDYLAVDPETRSILLYIEGVGDSRRFMSGLRVAARMKPVVVVKAGRYGQGSKAVVSHTGALVGSDDVFDAALQRAGVVRVMSIEELFSAAQILSSGYRVRGNRLGVVTNAGGPGVMAADRAVEGGVALPDLAASTMASLSGFLPSHWSRGNPIDILGDADPERYERAMAACLDDPGIDGALVMFTPQAMSQSTEVAERVVASAARSAKPVLTCWLGERQVADARRLFADERIPSFRTPEASIEAFSYLASHYRNQKLLVQVPGPLQDRREPDVEGARLVIEGALAEGRTLLSAMEARALMAAFHVPTTRCVEARSANEALVAAESLGFPVAMKINATGVAHKSDVGGVRLDIDSARAVRSVYHRMITGVADRCPDAQIHGVTVETMSRKRFGRELMVGVVRDPVFGPAISFGAGGTAVEIMRDRAIALPPLNAFIVRDLVARTRVAKLLGPFRNMPGVDFAAIENIMLAVSAMVCELPQIREFDINPLLVDECGAVAVDIRVAIDDAAFSAERYAHMAIHPYPSHLVERWQLSDGTDIVLRPIRPEDAEIEDFFVRNLSPESKYFRFMQALQELTPEMLVRFTQIDYDREMAFIATTEIEGKEAEVAVGRYVTNPDGRSCEFAIVVGDEWTRKGIGTRIMTALMQVARQRGLRTIEGEVLAENIGMLAMTRKLGFSSQPCPDDARIHKVSRQL